MAVIDIPEGLDEPHLNDIRKYLAEIATRLEGELQIVPGGLRVTSRLNASDTSRKKLSSVWVGTFEPDELKKARRFDADYLRFAQSNRSRVYQETLNDAKWNVHYRDWTVQFPEKTLLGYGP